MWDRIELKERGKAAFKANYWKSVLVCFVMYFLSGATSAASSNTTTSKTNEASLQNLDPKVLMAIGLALFGIISVIIVISVLLDVFVWNPLRVGCYQFFKRNVTDSNASLDSLMEGFSDYGHIFVTLLLKDLFLLFWSLLFFIPGIIKSYSYRMVPYIIKDEPQLSATEVITRSREMMDGNKWNAFVLDLSFLGWHLLGAITFGLVEIFWTGPYVENTNAALYLALRNGKNSQSW